MDILQNSLGQRLARFLDRPLFPWKKLIIGFSVAQYLFEGFLSIRQYRVLQKAKPPAVLEKEVTQDVFDKSQAYGRAKAKFELINGLWGQVQNLAFIHFDVLPKLWSWAGSLLLRFAPARFTGEISQSIVFVLSFIVIHQILSLPGSIYHTFFLEEKFGFNKQTPKLFITDMIKSNLLAFVLAPPILAGFLSIVQKTGNQFFYYLWLFGAGLQVFMITVYPIAILPLFNKLSPLQPGELKDGVEALAKKLKFPLHELYAIDGSKRSAHSNAYFFGLPWKKHIVIYDTLIEKSETEEVVAVLAHELGHWSLGHTTRLFGISQLHFFYIFALFSVFINNHSLYADFGFLTEHPIIVGFILFSDALAPMDMIIKLLMNILSRRYEFQADAFARGLGYNAELARSLIKLQIQNLSTMEADWMFANYHFSHPILSERLKALNWQSTEKVAADEKKDKEAAAVHRRAADAAGLNGLFSRLLDRQLKVSPPPSHFESIPVSAQTRPLTPPDRNQILLFSPDPPPVHPCVLGHQAQLRLPPVGPPARAARGLHARLGRGGRRGGGGGGRRAQERHHGAPRAGRRHADPVRPAQHAAEEQPADPEAEARVPEPDTDQDRAEAAQEEDCQGAQEAVHLNETVEGRQA
ncbi:uncharacterized protein E0L32_010937 [Thyridium curvatum]|uniref:Ste24 endopeptidase n=1 Tax=Thyridium curvatum TaxID=1093900 RepID=A0A507AL49_9PEZI|nr:uncharacterized protein E0L32_010937 [Thyridium curvatum]TPX07136.1 hypothetical protein E0L32_010937 [Thyridium curvatum]